MPQDQLDAAEERNALILSVPELRAAFADFMISSMRQVIELVAERSARSIEDPEVVAATGAVMGILLSSMLLGGKNMHELLNLIDEQLGHLETGFTL